MDLKKRKNFTSKKEDSFRMSLFLFLFLLSNLKRFSSSYVLQCSSATFLKTFRKIGEKHLLWRPLIVKFKFCKMDSATGVFLSLFQTPFYGCFETLNRSAFVLMLTMFGANIPESSKACQTVVVFSF